MPTMEMTWAEAETDLPAVPVCFSCGRPGAKPKEVALDGDGVVKRSGGGLPDLGGGASGGAEGCLFVLLIVVFVLIGRGIYRLVRSFFRPEQLRARIEPRTLRLPLCGRHRFWGPARGTRIVSADAERVALAGACRAFADELPFGNIRGDESA